MCNLVGAQANISEYIEPSGLPRELGGEDDWQYRWEPEQRREVSPEEEGGLEERGWTVSPPDRLVFRPKGETGELEAALFVASRWDGRRGACTSRDLHHAPGVSPP